MTMWEDELANNKETNGFPTSRLLPKTICKMAAVRYASRLSCYILIRVKVIMVIVDGLVPIWHRVICNCHDDVRRFTQTRVPQHNGKTWWRHQMVTGEFPAQRPVTRSFDVFSDLRLNKRLSKQWCGWWFETPSRPLWRHCNEIISMY